MRFLTVVFSSHEEFLSHFSNQCQGGALFCPTKAAVALHSQVIVDVSLPKLPQPARLRGQVVSKNSGQGLWVSFGAHSSATIDYLQECEASAPAHECLSRVHSRYPTSLSVCCRIDEDDPETETLWGDIVDLSRGGAFVSVDQAPLIGTRVSLDIESTRTNSSFRVDGRVAWVGKVDAHGGFGVRFDRSGNFGAAVVRTMLRKASETGRLQLS